MAVRWQEPPESRGRPRIFDIDPAEMDLLKANPGRWALVAENTHSGMASTFRERYPDLEISARTGDEDCLPGKVHLYARWPA